VHGGTIAVGAVSTDGPERGCRVTIRLPVGDTLR
jgi:hypothetical protein